MYAHSIKNPHIIHKQIKNDYIPRLFGDYRYLCCGSYTPEKATVDDSKVTCKNCLKMLSEKKLPSRV